MNFYTVYCWSAVFWTMKAAKLISSIIHKTNPNFSTSVTVHYVRTLGSSTQYCSNKKVDVKYRVYMNQLQNTDTLKYWNRCRGSTCLEWRLPTCERWNIFHTFTLNSYPQNENWSLNANLLTLYALKNLFILTTPKLPGRGVALNTPPIHSSIHRLRFRTRHCYINTNR